MKNSKLEVIRYALDQAGYSPEELVLFDHVDRLREALETAFNALLEVQPQIKGALPADSVQRAIVKANKALSAIEEEQG